MLPPSKSGQLTGMSIQIGYLDDDGHPRLTIRVSGTIQQPVLLLRL
jgi:hypothetical protein